jgi:glycosyltransferase involved in cell wall biosynthesis
MLNHKLVTVFLGIFNGEKYLDSLFHQIESQDSKEFNLLIVDNASRDKSFSTIKDWPKKLSKVNVKIVRNPRNFGGHRSLDLNLSLIETPWFTTMHQDDFYKPNHVSVLLALINKAGDEISGVSATMGSMTNEGKRVKPFPRSTWFDSELDKYGQFLQNIKSQSIPFPCTAFKTNIYKKTQVLTHSPSFSDTEQTLKMLCYGKFLVSNEETMLYRENPVSESHALNEDEREIGSYIGLNRVFASQLFIDFIQAMDRDKSFEYLELLKVAVEERVTDYKLQQVLQIGLIENVLESFGYNNKEMIKLLSGEYVKFASFLTLQNLSNLSESSVDLEKIEEKNLSVSPSWKKKFWDMYFLSNISVPDIIHKKAIKALYKVVFRMKPNHRWNTKWK